MVARRTLLLAGVAAAAISCGSPSTPSVVVTPPVTDQGPPVSNTPPVIGKFTVQGTRTNEPANFADVGEEVPVSVVVTDAESNPDDLKYNWSAALGTFTGNSRNVKWIAPPAVDAPTTVELKVQVVETYTSQGKSVTNTVEGSTTLSLHDSVKEVGDMARQFLVDFSETSTMRDVPTIMRNFEPGCYGTDAETAQVTNHLLDFNVLRYTAGPAVTTVHFGGICPFRSLQGDACAQVRMHWESQAKHDLYDASGGIYLRAGGVDTQDGVDQVAAMYYPIKQRWRLCDSAWDSDTYHTLNPRAIFHSLVP